MLLNKIKLTNIRSYLSEEIIFPEGSVLLSGNIGSGKSSILLAIDFVLFGLSPGKGSALLRNGADKGEVELHFLLDNKEVIIKRSLKRKKKSVTQDYGYLLIDGRKIEGTATELKARILQLLNYPKEMLSKSKDLVYKYTVYTPQEEMKSILLGDKDSRLETLRKVFGIDKYKRIVNNSDIFLKSLRSKIREFDIRIEKLDYKLKEKEDKKIEFNKIKEDIISILSEYDKINLKLKDKREEIKNIEEKINERNKLKNELNINENNLKNYNERIENEKEQINSLRKNILDLEEELENKKEEEIEELIYRKSELKTKIDIKEKEIRELRDKIVKLKSKKEESENLKEKIIDLDNCPTCLQEVKDEHKNKIIEREEEKLKLLNEEINKINIQEEEKNLELIKNDLDEIGNKISEVNIIKLKFKELKEKKERIELLNKNISDLNLKIEDYNKKIIEIKHKIKDNLEEKYGFLKKDLDELILKDKNIGIKKAQLEETQNNLIKDIDELKKEVLIMENIRKNLDYYRQLEKWLNDVFINMMNLMEKKIMLRAHNDFNNLFEKWFNILVENEMLNVKLDEEFTPTIILNGYDTDYAHLSGGERTAAALSYRLALNQVINNLMSDIKTRDLIILDEPTDGFSSEQLDRVRLVLQELNLRQIIIVSHEPKVESFVNNVLRFEKKEHVSKLI